MADKKVRRLIFLDVDGVLNHLAFYEALAKKGGTKAVQSAGHGTNLKDVAADDYATIDKHFSLDPETFRRLQEVYKKFPFDVVLSSTWRKSDWGWKTTWEKLFRRHGFEANMIGQTPDYFTYVDSRSLDGGTSSWWRSTEIAAFYSMFDNHIRRLYGEANLVQAIAIDDDRDVWTVGDPWLPVITSSKTGFDDQAMRQTIDTFDFLNGRTLCS